MIDVFVLTFDEVVPSSVTGVIDLLTGANNYLRKNDQGIAFNIKLVSDTPSTLFTAFPGQEISQQTFKEAIVPSLVIVPSFSVGNDTDAVLNKNRAAIRWISEVNDKGAEVASLCVGCYFLAEAGLLHNKEVTSHWAVATDIQKRYPTLTMKSDLVITDKDGIYTSGGAFSSLKLVLYLIEKFCGRETALWISKMYAVDMDGASQAHFAVFSGQHHHEDSQILQAQRHIEKNYQEDINIGSVALLVNMGTRNFIRRFKAATNNTPFEYLQRVRIESAKKAIEMSGKELSCIIDDTGYNDIKTFRTIFKRFTGLSPLEYKKKYSRVQ